VFCKAQEAIRKDVERAFGVLQSRFAIVKGPSRFWSRDDLNDIMTTCVILHNKIVEHESGNEEELDYHYDSSPMSPVDSTPAELSRDSSDSFNMFVERYLRIRDRDINKKLKADLIEEQYKYFGSQTVT
jgi:hypothetical protein